MPAKRVRAAVKLPTDGLEDPDVLAQADNKDAKRSDGTTNKYAQAAAAASGAVVNRYLQTPPAQYPVPTTTTPWSADAVALTARDKAVAQKARFLNSKFHYSGFYLRQPLLGTKPTTILATAPGAPGTVAPIAVTASVSLPNAAAVAALHEVARYSDRYRLMEGKRDLADEIPNPSDSIFPKDLLRRLKKKPRLAAPTAAAGAGASARPAAAAAAAQALIDAQLEGLSASDAVRIDPETGRPVFDAAAAAAALDDEEGKSAFDRLVVDDGSGAAEGKKKGAGDDDDGEGKAAGTGDADEVGAAEADPEEDEEDGDYRVEHRDDDEDGNDAFGDDGDDGVM